MNHDVRILDAVPQSARAPGGRDAQSRGPARPHGASGRDRKPAGNNTTGETAGAEHRAVTADAARYIIKHLRQRDREEIFALRWNDDEEEFLRQVMLNVGRMTWCWWRDGRPVSLQGAWPVRPGVWSCWAFGTDDWPRVVLSMTRHSRRFIIPALLRARFHRAEASALATHTDSRRWIEALGGRQESVLRGYGRHGEDFITYVWTPNDVLRWWRGR